jgi:hypothetical protein
LKRIIESLNKLVNSRRSFILAVVACVVVIEIVTCIGRFGFDISMKEKEGAITALIFGVRIHHGYVGAFCLLSAFVITRFKLKGDFNTNLLYIGGWALLISDIIHHFIVLYLIVGKTEFP